MKDILNDIRAKINNGVYGNEEHIRFSLVARLLEKLGWDIWNPHEVNTEYATIPNEDKTKVDIALFSKPHRPSVFIEVKALGKLKNNLQNIEIQLRDYNRNNTALFSIITDGRFWRFYLSQTGGTFSDKCFESLDLITDDLEELEISFCSFLQKSEIDNKNAERDAREYLKLTQIQRLMEKLLPQARRLVLEPPFPNLLDALVELVAESGFTISIEEAEKFVQKVQSKVKSTKPLEPPVSVSVPQIGDVKEFDPQSVDLRFTSIINANIGNEEVTKWNTLLKAAIKTSLQKGLSILELQRLGVSVEKGIITDRGFKPIRDENVSLQYVQATKACQLSFMLAKKLHIKIKVHFKWRHNEDAAHPGMEGILHWSP